jgi:hypothetical protein
MVRGRGSRVLTSTAISVLPAEGGSLRETESLSSQFAPHVQLRFGKTKSQ